MRLSVVTGPAPQSAPVASAALAEGAADFGAVYDEHFAFVWRSLRRLGVADAHLDDAAQDVFLVVYRRLAEFEGRSSLKTWLFGIVLRVVRTHRRTAMRKPTEPLDVEPHANGSAPEELTEAAQAARLLHALLGELDDAPRAVFVLAELEEMTAPEISAALGVNLNTVYSRLRAARRDFDAALARHRARSPR
jgi:RNA polymerase sigma-70 factor (ECF subfamily)